MIDFWCGFVIGAGFCVLIAVILSAVQDLKDADEY